MLIGILVFDICDSMMEEGSKITGAAAFAGYMTLSIFIFKNDITKLIENLKKIKNK